MGQKLLLFCFTFVILASTFQIVVGMETNSLSVSVTLNNCSNPFNCGAAIAGYFLDIIQLVISLALFDAIPGAPPIVKAPMSIFFTGCTLLVMFELARKAADIAIKVGTLVANATVKLIDAIIPF